MPSDSDTIVPVPPARPNRPAIARRGVLPILILILGGIMSVILWQALKAHVSREIHHATMLEAATVRNAIRDAVRTRLEVLSRIAARATVWPGQAITQEQWAAEVGMLPRHFPSFAALAVVDTAGKAQVGMPEHPAASAVDEVPARDTVSSIPPTLLRGWMDEASASNAPVLTELPAVTDATGPTPPRTDAVAVIALPSMNTAASKADTVSRGTASGTARRCIVAVIQLPRLFNSTLHSLEQEESALRGYSFAFRTNGEILYERAEGDRGLEERWSYHTELQLGSIALTLQVWPGREIFNTRQTWLPLIALGAGLLTSLLLAVVTHLAMAARRHAAASERATKEATLATRTVSHQFAFLSAMLNNLQEGIVACDADGQLTLVNPARRMFQGMRPNETPAPISIQTIQQHLYAADGHTPLAWEQTPLARALEGENVVGQELVIAPPDGPRRTLVANGQAIYDENHCKLGAVVTMHDITARQEAQEQLRRSAEQLDRSNKALQDFASVASHDLQEPLRKIQAFGDRLRARSAEHLGESGLDYLGRMQSAAGRMQRLIDDLLTYSRVSTRALPFEPTNLNEIAEGVMSDLEARVEQLNARVEIGPLPTLDADPLQMRQLLQNLIGNAMKFHKPGEQPRVRVTASVERETTMTPDGAAHGGAVGENSHPEDSLIPADAQWCILSVEDNGIGFDEKYLDRIFTVFQRLHGRAEYAGTGVGLAICNKIAQRHGGSISAHSAPGQGACFVVTLPIHHGAAEEATPLLQCEHHHASTPEFRHSFDPKEEIH